MGEETVDEIFHALKVIGSLRENERVRTESVPFSIDRTGNFQFLMRWWYNETRMKNIQAVAKVFNDAFSVADMALAKEESYRNILGETAASFNSSHVSQPLRVTSTDTASPNGSLPEGEVSMDQIMGLMSAK